MSAMYLQNKYTRWYYNIVRRAQSSTTVGYVEKHHIIPKSLGGDNHRDNLVSLTAREHFVCHLLLTKMTTGIARKKMVLAVFYLSGKGKSSRNNVIKSSRIYERLRRDLAEFVSFQKKGCKQPPRSILSRKRYSESKSGAKNPNHLGLYITPRGTYESSRQAAANCPSDITGNFIIRLCRTNNLKPINLLSVCRSNGYLTREFIGHTPCQLGFYFVKTQ